MRRKNLIGSLHRCVAAAALLLIVSISSSAETIEEYKQNIAAARSEVQGLINLYYEETPSTGNGRESIQRVRKLLPALSKVEWDGTEITVRNDWLAARLNALEDAPFGSDERQRILVEIESRLGALEFRVAEIETGVVAGDSTSKDELKRRLAGILAREEYSGPKDGSKSPFARFWEWLAEYLEWIFPRINIPVSSTAPGESPASRIAWVLIIILLLAIGGYVLYRVLPFLRGRKRREKLRKRERVILGERLAPDTGTEDLLREAESLIREGDFRGAIRKGYIALLCELGEKRVIAIEDHKTNRDYLGEVAMRRRELSGPVGVLTRGFERHWYGEVPAGEEDWQNFRQGFDETTGGSA